MTTKDAPGLRILRFSASNVKRLQVVEFDPDRNVVIVAGDNMEGKSSVLDSLVYAFCGAGALPSVPIRKGEESANVKLDLGAFTVSRRITKKGEYLVVEDKEGRRYSSPQSMLSALYDEIAFDLDGWLRKPGREQHAALLKISDIGVDIDANRREHKEVFAARRDLSRDFKRVDATLKGFGDIPEIEARPSAKILKEMRAAERINTDNETARKRLALAGKERDSYVDKVDAARAELERTERTLAAWKKEEAAAQELAGNLEDCDLAPLREELEQAEAASAARARRELFARLDKERTELAGTITKHRKHLEQLDGALRDGLQAADFPVEGLSVSADEVLYNDLPLAQASQAERLRVALAIAMRVQERKDKRLSVVRIMDGSLLDDKSMELVRQQAEEHDFQVWIERIEKDGAQIIIEDGRIAAESA